MKHDRAWAMSEAAGYDSRKSCGIKDLRECSWPAAMTKLPPNISSLA